MEAAAAAVAMDKPPLEQQITNAAAEASAIVAHFSPAAGAAIAAGAEVEPIVSGLVKLFIHFFHHAAKKQAA